MHNSIYVFIKTGANSLSKRRIREEVVPGFQPPPPTFLKSIEKIKKREKRERHGLKQIYLFSFWMYTRL